MNWVLSALVASWVAGCVGYIVRGWVDAERHRTIPEHPALRRRTQRPTLRVIDGDYQRPFDQDRTGG